jgi:hypothetical protein
MLGFYDLVMDASILELLVLTCISPSSSAAPSTVTGALRLELALAGRSILLRSPLLLIRS